MFVQRGIQSLGVVRPMPDEIAEIEAFAAEALDGAVLVPTDEGLQAVPESEVADERPAP